MDIKLNLSYCASIMLNAFKDLLCSKLYWHNRSGPMYHYSSIAAIEIMHLMSHGDSHEKMALNYGGKN